LNILSQTIICHKNGSTQFVQPNKYLIVLVYETLQPMNPFSKVLLQNFSSLTNTWILLFLQIFYQWIPSAKLRPTNTCMYQTSIRVSRVQRWKSDLSYSFKGAKMKGCSVTVSRMQRWKLELCYNFKDAKMKGCEDEKQSSKRTWRSVMSIESGNTVAIKESICIKRTIFSTILAIKLFALYFIII